MQSQFAAAPMTMPTTAPAESPSVLVDLHTPALRQKRLRASSREAYARDVDLFTRFGGSFPSTAADVVRYIDKLRPKLAPPTIYRRVMAIAHHHRALGHASPIDDRLRGMLRWLAKGKLPPKGSKPLPPPPEDKREGRSAKPMTRAVLSRLLDAVLRNALDRRDEALILLGFMGGLKRGQLVAIDAGDCSWTNDAMLIRIKAEMDESGRRQKDRVLAIPKTGGELCASSSVSRYCEHLDLPPDAPLFVSYNRAGEPTGRRLAAASVSEVLKRRLITVGIDATHYSGESLRKGRIAELLKGAPI